MISVGDCVRVTNGGCNYSSRSIMVNFPKSGHRMREFVGIMGSLRTGKEGIVIESYGGGYEIFGGLHLVELNDGSGLYAVSGDGLMVLHGATEQDINIDVEALLGFIQN